MMRSRVAFFLGLFLVIGFCNGCDNVGFVSAPPTIRTASPFELNGHMSNTNGGAVGEVCGVRIHVAETDGGGVRTSSTIAGSAAQGVGDAKHTIEVGDVTITLEKGDGALILLNVNGMDYGQIQKGDELFVDAERAVTVNGELRSAL